MISSVHTRGNSRARFSFKAKQELTRKDFLATILRISGVLNSSMPSIIEMLNGSTWMLQLCSLSVHISIVHSESVYASPLLCKHELEGLQPCVSSSHSGTVNYIKNVSLDPFLIVTFTGTWTLLSFDTADTACSLAILMKIAFFMPFNWPGKTISNIASA